MREPQTLNGGESGSWWRYDAHIPLDDDETRPVPRLPHLSDRDIQTLIDRIEEKPELAPAFLPASLLYT